MTVRAAEAFSTQSDAGAAARDLAREARAGLAGVPLRGGLVYATCETEVSRLLDCLRAELDGIPMIGCTSCLGVGGLGFDANRPAVGSLWLGGEEVRFGTAQADRQEDDARSRGARVARQALAEAGIRADEVSFALIHPTPGEEEELLRGVYQVLPPEVPIIGGSAADDDLTGRWQVWGGSQPAGDSVALGVCRWPFQVGQAFQSGYLPGERSGLATRAEGRVLYEIDGRPAGVVYDEWTEGALRPELESGGAVWAQSTLYPLGIVRGKIFGFDLYVLVHPERVYVPDRSIGVFANVREGERVVLMQSSTRSLVERPGNVARQALRDCGTEESRIVASLMIYCGGSLLAIADHGPSMFASYRQAIGKAPSIAAYTFGEQGSVMPGRFEHGNLMANVLVLSDVPATGSSDQPSSSSAPPRSDRVNKKRGWFRRLF